MWTTVDGHDAPRRPQPMTKDEARNSTEPNRNEQQNLWARNQKSGIEQSYENHFEFGENMAWPLV